MVQGMSLVRRRDSAQYALARTRTWNTGTADLCDLPFTTRTEPTLRAVLPLDLTVSG